MLENRYKGKASFTLIELLVVIGIIAILAIAVVVVLNPVERVKAARDAKRAEDLSSLNEAIQVALTQDSNLSLGTPSVVYTSLVDAASSTCGSLGLPALPSGMTYNCVTSEENLRKTDGTGWLPINLSSIGAIGSIPPLPVDPLNSTSTYSYYLYVMEGTLYKLQAIVESIKYIEIANKDGGTGPMAIEKGPDVTLSTGAFPQGWVKIPGSSTYGTSDFWVMQYEAKYDTDGDGTGDGANSCSGTTNAWDWDGVGIDCPASWEENSVVSSPQGSVIAGIPISEAKIVCQQKGGHLIINKEWMTITRNAERQPQNWTGGAVGSGCLFMGSGGSYVCGYSGVGIDSGINRNQKARFTLSNNSEIWDIAGNASEMVSKDLTTDAVSDGPRQSSNNTWKMNLDLIYLTSYGELGYNGIRASDSSYDINKGMGYIELFFDGAGASRCMKRGLSGAFAIHLGYDCASVHGSDVGFRCVK